MPRPVSTPRKDPVPIVQETGWTTGPVWTGAENLAPIGIRSADRPARSQSLHQLSYRAHSAIYKHTKTRTLTAAHSIAVLHMLPNGTLLINIYVVTFCCVFSIRTEKCE
jgi:hypothetical protein